MWYMWSAIIRGMGGELVRELGQKEDVAFDGDWFKPFHILVFYFKYCLSSFSSHAVK